MQPLSANNYLLHILCMFWKLFFIKLLNTEELINNHSKRTSLYSSYKPVSMSDVFLWGGFYCTLQLLLWLVNPWTSAGVLWSLEGSL